MNPPRFIIRYNGYAAKFHTNVCGKVFSLVADREATHFTDAAEAVTTAVHHGMKYCDAKLANAPDERQAA